MTEPLPLLFALHVAAAAALLVWSVRLVRTGIERGFAHALRTGLRRSAGSRPAAAFTGMGAALLLQSSTAVALLVASFLQGGAIAPTAGLAILLGADLGSAIVTQVLILRPEWITSALVLAGVVLFLSGGARRTRQVGRVLVGLGLIFMSLDLLARAAATLPVAALGGAAGYLNADPVSAFLIGALVAWAMHSSVAAVLVFATLGGTTALGGPALIALVLGANLGGALVALLLTLRADVAVRRVVAANFAARGGAALLALAALGSAGVPPYLSDLAAPAQAIAAHIAFNALLLVVALPLAGVLLRLAAAVVPDAADPPDLRISALDPAAIARPPLALACARREILRMGEEVEAMLRAVLPLYRDWDDRAGEEIMRREARVDGMHFHTKLYLSRLIRESGDPAVGDSAADLVTLAGQMEAAGDEISANLLSMARRVHDEGRSFSDAGWRELSDFHDRVLGNTAQALQVIMTPEVDTARALVEEKDALRQVEARLQMSHLSRLQSGFAESVETSNIHQETLRSLKAVNAAFAVAAHPTLTDAGEILTTRLARPAETRTGAATPDAVSTSLTP